MVDGEKNADRHPFLVKMAGELRRRFGTLREWDFYRKIPADLTKGTVSGAGLSIFAVFVLLVLFILEFQSYLTVSTTTKVVLDERTEETLQLNFNISFPRLSCDIVSVDISDVMGTKLLNITENIRRWRLARNGEKRIRLLPSLPKNSENEPAMVMNYHHDDVHDESEQLADELDVNSFETFIKSHKLVLVNYYATWCPWSRKLAPVWEHTSGLLLENPEMQNIVKLARVNCENKAAHKLCHDNHIQAFPTILVYLDGNTHSHDHFHGERTSDALMKFIQAKLSNSIVMKTYATEVKPEDGPQGCMIEGSVFVRKVPGALIIPSTTVSHSINTQLFNLTHSIYHLSFGPFLSVPKLSLLKKEVHSSINRYHGQIYSANDANWTYEHYIKVVPTTFLTLSGNEANYYKYTVTNHGYKEESQIPRVKFSYDLSPMAVHISETKMPFYHFITSACAIIGGVFTVLGLVDSVVYHSLSAFEKKVELGKTT